MGHKKVYEIFKTKILFLVFIFYFYLNTSVKFIWIIIITITHTPQNYKEGLYIAYKYDNKTKRW